MKKNARNREFVENQKPIFRNVSVKDLEIKIYHCVNMESKRITIEGFCIKEGDNSVQKFFDALKKARGIDKCFNGILLKEYIEQNDCESFDEKIFLNYKEARINELKKQEEMAMKARVDKYWSCHIKEKEELLEKQKNLNNQLEKLKHKMKPREEEITKLNDEYFNLLNNHNEEIEKIRKKITDFNDQKLALGLFKISEKKELANKINELYSILSEEEKQKEEVIKIKKGQYDKRINDIKEEIVPIKKEIELIEKEYQNIQYELTRDRINA